MKRAVIFAGGDMDTDEVWNVAERENWLVICADGGFRHARRLGIQPDVIIGDCDSTDVPYPEAIPHSIHPAEKDETDTRLCLDWAMEQGCREVLILGGLGGRLDHEFSNYNLLLYGLKRGVSVRLVNGQNEIWLEDKSFTLEPGDKKYVSFFPYGGAVEGFGIKGLKYELAPMTLTCDTVLTACNEFLPGQQGEVFFQKGYVLVMMCQDSFTVS